MDSRKKGHRLLAVLAVTTASLLLVIAIGVSVAVFQKAKADACDAALAIGNPGPVTLTGIQPNMDHIFLLSFEFSDERGRNTVRWSLSRWQLTRHGDR
jgi:hypothetical protein